MNTPKDLKYAKTHEWVRVKEQVAYVGISDYAQDSLGDMVYVELPKADAEFARGEEVATIESVKAASTIYAPLSGSIVEVNEALSDQPELINQNPYEAFIFAVKMSDPAELNDLLDAGGYEKFLEQEEK